MKREDELLQAILQRYTPDLYGGSPPTLGAIIDKLPNASITDIIRIDIRLTDCQNFLAPLAKELATKLLIDESRQQKEKRHEWEDFVRQTKISFLGVTSRDLSTFLLGLEARLKGV